LSVLESSDIINPENDKMFGPVRKYLSGLPSQNQHA
jgi:hypothetical protein